jgi:hypothetical protein
MQNGYSPGSSVRQSKLLPNSGCGFLGNNEQLVIMKMKLIKMKIVAFMG